MTTGRAATGVPQESATPRLREKLSSHVSAETRRPAGAPAAFS